MLPAVILCGGFGTRLRPVLADRPKALAPVNGEPFLGHLLARLAREGCEQVVLSTGYLADMIEAYAGDGSRWGLRVHFAREPEPLGTGGALRFAAGAAGLRGAFIALNGDTFFSGTLAELQAFHERKKAAATVALVSVPSAERYGTVETEPDAGLITAFREKDAARTGPALINAGVYVLGPELVSAIPPERAVSLEREVFPAWIGRGLYGRPYPDAAFLDIGTPEDLARAPELLA